jgi:hypothetical protein
MNLGLAQTRMQTQAHWGMTGNVHGATATLDSRQFYITTKYVCRCFARGKSALRRCLHRYLYPAQHLKPSQPLAAMSRCAMRAQST